MSPELPDLQHLPIGAIDSPHAVRLRRVPAAPLFRMRLHVLLTAAGVAAAVAGAVASAAPAPVEVRMTADTYDIGGSQLTATEPGVYLGPDGAAVVVERVGSTTRAGASAGLDGAHMTGACTLADGAGEETCRFTLDGRAFSAVDTWTAGGWRRRYEDGRRVDIGVAGGRPVPVPIAVGR
jgi:hypothetical protein